MLNVRTPMSHCETPMSHLKQQCWIIKLKCRMVKNKVIKMINLNIESKPWILAGYNAIKKTLFKWNENLIAWTSKRWPWHVRPKTTFANIHVKNMSHLTELELNTRAFAPPFVHIPFIPVGRTKECQECAHILLQVGASAVRFKNVPLTTKSKISLRSRSCSPAIKKCEIKTYNSVWFS